MGYSVGTTLWTVVFRLTSHIQSQGPGYAAPLGCADQQHGMPNAGAKEENMGGCTA